MNTFKRIYFYDISTDLDNNIKSHVIIWIKYLFILA